MSILDFARWAGWNAGEGKREPQLVRPETLRKLHTPVTSTPEKKEAAPGTPSHGRYALGWGELTVPWAPGPMLYYAARTDESPNLIFRNHESANVTATNFSSLKADEGLLALARELYIQFTVKEEKPK